MQFVLLLTQNASQTERRRSGRDCYLPGAPAGGVVVVVVLLTGGTVVEDSTVVAVSGAPVVGVAPGAVVPVAPGALVVVDPPVVGGPGRVEVEVDVVVGRRFGWVEVVVDRSGTLAAGDRAG